MSEPEIRHEPDARAASSLFVILCSTLAVILLISLGLWLGLQVVSEPAGVGEWPAPAQREGDRPALQADPQTDLAAFERRMQERLDSVGWVDRQAGIVHLPIDRAMDLLVERGLTEEVP